MEIKSVSDFRKAMRSGPYAWPGGYPCYFLMADGEPLSFKAAQENRKQIVFALAHGTRHNDDWKPVAFEINYEDENMICAHSGKHIECAYPSSKK